MDLRPAVSLLAVSSGTATADLCPSRSNIRAGPASGILGPRRSGRSPKRCRECNRAAPDARDLSPDHRRCEHRRDGASSVPIRFRILSDRFAGVIGNVRGKPGRIGVVFGVGKVVHVPLARSKDARCRRRWHSNTTSEALRCRPCKVHTTDPPSWSRS